MGTWTTLQSLPGFENWHNFEIMDRRRLARHIRRVGGRLTRCDYDVTWEFWPPRGEGSPLMGLAATLVGSVSRHAGRVLQKLRCADIPNPLFSPHIIAVARKA